MTKTRVSLLVIVCLAGASYAASFALRGHLTGAKESPPNNSPGVGDAQVSYNEGLHELTIDVSFSDLEAGTTAAHIHCCVAPNGTAGVATTTPSFAGFPLGVTSGQFHTVLDLTQASSFNSSFVTAHGGVAGAEAALTTGLADGMAYLNIHTSAHGGGEIRAFLVTAFANSPSLSVTGLAVLAMLLAVAGFRWARRASGSVG